MRAWRIILAHAIVMTGCSESHIGSDDGGIDAGSSEFDAGFPVDDAGPPSSCSAARAAAEVCPDLLCDGPPRWYWNGDDCFWIDCGACTGEDCETHGFLSEAACLAAHEGCDAPLCRASGGTWRWWDPQCGHHVCGVAPPANCESPFPVCDCGPFARFEFGEGCVADPDCPIPEPVTREELCTGTGGAWGAFCCDSECGVPCGDDCAAMACDCGPGLVFDDVRGCHDGARCHERNAGETCNGVARCAEGTICCQACGGAGCFGDPTCDAPSCDDDPGFDECGNCLLCP